MDIVSTTVSQPIPDTSDSDLLFSAASSLPRYYQGQTTFHAMEQQQHYQQQQQRQQQQFPGEAKFPSSSAIGIQDIIGVKNEIANTKLELSSLSAAAISNPIKRTPIIVRLETKIERLETLLIEYLRMERLETSMMEYLRNKHNEGDDGADNLTVTGSVAQSTIAGTTSSYQNNHYRPVGPPSIISDNTPTKSIWLTNQRPTATQHDPYHQHTDEQPVPLEDLWDLLDLAEQLSYQS